MRCHYITDEKTGERILIPGCYGTVHSNGMEDCTCPKHPKKKDDEKINQLLWKVHKQELNPNEAQEKIMAIIFK